MRRTKKVNTVHCRVNTKRSQTLNSSSDSATTKIYFLIGYTKVSTLHVYMVDQSSQSKECLSSKQWTVCARWHDDTWVMIVVRGKNSRGNITDPNRTSTKGLNRTRDIKTSLNGEPQPSSH